MCDLFEGTGKPGPDSASLVFNLEERRPALVAFQPEEGLPVIGASGAHGLEEFQSRHVPAVPELLPRNGVAAIRQLHLVLVDYRA
jgi:hypothetical protein